MAIKLRRTTIAVIACLSLSAAAITNASATTTAASNTAASATSLSSEAQLNQLSRVLTQIGNSPNKIYTSTGTPADQGADSSSKSNIAKSPAGQIILFIASVLSLALAVLPLITKHLPQLQGLSSR